MNLHALFAGHVLAMLPDQLAVFAERAAAIGHLVQAGLGPVEKFGRALDGRPTTVAEIQNGAALIDLRGPLLLNAPWFLKGLYDVTDYGDLAAAIRDALSTPKVDAIVLRCDSPGGSAAGLEAVRAAIEEAQAVGIPVTMAIDGMCCSAAYFLATCCDRITATPDSLVGCIGTYTVAVDSTVADAKAGLAYILIGSGGVKGHGADGKVTAELRAELQAMVDQYAALFCDRIAAGREMTAEAVAALCTGQCWIARAAPAGLLDAVELTPSFVRRSASGTAPTKPAAAGVSQESTMDAKTQAALAALSESHPHLAAKLVKAANAEAATPEALHALVATEALAAKDAEIEQLKAEKSTAEAKAKSEAEEAEKQRKLAALAGGSAADPGGAAAGTRRRSQMSSGEKSDFIAKNGRDAYLALPN
jgi:ClpP class serine protease